MSETTPVLERARVAAGFAAERNRWRVSRLDAVVSNIMRDWHRYGTWDELTAACERIRREGTR